MSSELQCVLWDFGNTLAKEAFSHASRELPDWPDAFKAVHALYGDAWDSGTLSDKEFAKLMAERLDVPMPLVRQDLEQRCASISFFDESLRVVEACRLPQVLVTVNPPLFSELIVPQYAVFKRFEMIVTSWEERVLDKAELCAVALSRLQVAIAPSATLLIDNMSDNVKRWEQRGGQGYWFRGPEVLKGDLSGALLAHLNGACRALP